MSIFDNPIIENIYTRRAVRKYKNLSVSQELINKIIAAGRMAPSAINKQPWKFYVLNNPKLIKHTSEAIRSSSKWQMLKAGLKEAAHALLHPTSFKFSDGINFLKEEDPIFHGAPVVILITAPKNDEWAALDIGMCCQNMMLAATSYGVATCPVGLAKFIEHTNECKKLGISDSETVQLAILIGYPNEEPKLHTRTTDNVKFVE